MGVLSYVKLFVCVAVILGCLGIWWYINSLKSELRTSQENLSVSEENNAQLQDAIKTERETLASKTQEFSQVRALMDRQNTLIRAQSREIQSLNEKFRVSASGAVRDLGNLALAKPGLVQDAINSGTSNALKCLERSTALGGPQKCD